MIYEETFNASFHRKLESVQYNAALATTMQYEGHQEKNSMRS